MNFREIMTIGIGNADTLSYVRGAVGLICLCAFLMTWRVSIGSYKTRATQMARHAQRWGVALVGIYYWLSASTSIPTPDSSRVSPLLIVVYVGTILVALSIAFTARDSPYRKDRIDQPH